MGFLDHLFKLKQSDEKMGDGEKGAVPDPGAFLQPKDFRPRGGGTLHPPARPAAPVAKEPPLAQEIVLILGDVLSRIPTPLLQPGFHDANRELRFSIDDLSADIARGRAAVPLSKIAALCPDVFAREIAPGDDSEIRLPLQKLVEQIGLLRGRPAVSPAEPSAPGPQSGEEPSPAPPPAAAPAAAAPLENHTPDPAPDTTPPDAPATAHETPRPAFHIHPPPVVRPILLPPPTLLAARDHPPEPLVFSSPSPPVETAPAPDHPPHFPQEALQALFMTDEALDLAGVCRHAAALPGVRACALEWHGESALAGDTPAGFDLAALRATASLHTRGSLPIGSLESVTLHGGQAAISIFTRPGVLLAVLHHALPPGVRERLAALASALAPL